MIGCERGFERVRKGWIGVVAVVVCVVVVVVVVVIVVLPTFSEFDCARRVVSEVQVASASKLSHALLLMSVERKREERLLKEMERYHLERGEVTI